MKARLIFSFFLFIIATNLLSQNLFEESDSLTISHVLSKLESHYDVSFSYNSGEIATKKIFIEKGSFDLDQIVELIFKQLDYTYEYVDDKNILIIPHDKNDVSFRSICGYIKDQLSNDVVSFVNIYTEDSHWGTTTDAQGYFELELPSQYKSVTASFIGYENLEISLIKIDKDCNTFVLKEDSEILSTVILREYLDDGIAQSGNTKSIILNPDKMNILPGLVDHDVFASILMLPGINSPSESLDGIYMRGGTPDQNLVLWDDIPVYHTSHLFGSFSAFNPFMIDQIDVYRSAISSEFGGRVSGVVDITSKSAIPDKIHFGMGINMTHAHFDFETPLWKNSALYISFRRSITDLWASPTFLNYADRIFQGSRVDPERFANSSLTFDDHFAFNDANLKWVYNLPKDKFEISTFGALNRLNYSTELPNTLVLDKLKLNNGGAKISWAHDWTDKLSTDFILTSSEYKYEYEILAQSEKQEEPNRGFLNNRIRDGGLKLMFNWQPKEFQKFKLGYQLTDNKISFELGRREVGIMEKDSQDFVHRLSSLVGEYSLELPNIINMDMGLRFQYNPVLNKRFFEPRISVVTRLNEFMRLKASTSKQFQFVSQLVPFDNNLAFTNQIWVASDENGIPVIESNQWVGGIIIEKNDWTLDIEGYVKELVGITTLSALADLSAPFAQGQSKFRGVDVLLKRRLKNFRSWISYTLSESIYEFPTIPPGSFPAPQDQQHILQWVNIYKQGPWEFSLGVNMRSGLPFRDAEGLKIILNEMGQLATRIEYAELNSRSLKPYFRVDGSVIYNFGNESSTKGYIGFSMQNITGHTNVLGRDFYQGNLDGPGFPTLLSNDELGLKFTPNLSINVQW